MAIPQLSEDILTKILSYSFNIYSISTPFLPPTPIKGTASLLLVSKLLHELSLPFFWRSITLHQPSDFISLFDPEDGFLAAKGELGDRRRSWVKELCFGEGAAAPYDVDLLETKFLQGLEASSLERQAPHPTSSHRPSQPQARLPRRLRLSYPFRTLLFLLLLDDDDASLVPASPSEALDPPPPQSQGGLVRRVQSSRGMQAPRQTLPRRVRASSSLEPSSHRSPPRTSRSSTRDVPSPLLPPSTRRIQKIPPLPQDPGLSNPQLPPPRRSQPEARRHALHETTSVLHPLKSDAPIAPLPDLDLAGSLSKQFPRDAEFRIVRREGMELLRKQMEKGARKASGEQKERWANWKWVEEDGRLAPFVPVA